jgi:selenocysteine lyase/cysteine desulfurase
MAAIPQLVGADTTVPCVDGRPRRYANLDYAASAPVMTAVWEAVEAFLPWYSSVHRGSGVKSQVSTAAYEDARHAVCDFVGGRAEDAVVFVRNTTEAVNVLSAALPAGTRVLSSAIEHHSAMLPWRRHDLRLLGFTASPDELLEECERALRAARTDLVAVTGASNVTGEVWPVAELAALAHAHGARLFVDAAQLAPHRPVDMAGTGIDFLAFSGHKLYAPFGAGALVGDARLLEEAGAPLLQGGGAIELVTPDDVIWACAPERHEAGSPNVVGAVALAAACRALLDFGMDALAAHERVLSALLWRGLADVPGLRRLSLWPDDADRVGVATFTLAGYRHPLLAAILSAEHGIGVRHGCFCAHLLMTRLLGVPDAEVGRLAAELRAGRRPALPGAVRASIGLGTTVDDIDRLVDALHEITAAGPRARYEHLPGVDEYVSRVEGPARAEHGLERRGVQRGRAFEQHAVTVEPSGVDDHALGKGLRGAHPDVVLGAAELVTAGRRDRDAVRGHPDRGTGEQHMRRAVDGDHEGHQIAVEVAEVAALGEFLGDQPSGVGPADRERPAGGTADDEQRA